MKFLIAILGSTVLALLVPLVSFAQFNLELV